MPATAATTTLDGDAVRRELDLTQERLLESMEKGGSQWTARSESTAWLLQSGLSEFIRGRGKRELSRLAGGMEEKSQRRKRLRATRKRDGSQIDPSAATATFTLETGESRIEGLVRLVHESVEHQLARAESLATQ
jgi:hypothetical protein